MGPRATNERVHLFLKRRPVLTRVYGLHLCVKPRVFAGSVDRETLVYGFQGADR